MISSLTGELRRVDEDRIHLQVGPLGIELLIGAADAQLLSAGIGEEITLHTLFYIEGDAGGGGNLEPRLIGFLNATDKGFFQKFITVKGIGPKKALKALIFPAGEIAQAIESKDTRFLVGLPQIGKRMAELIVAELSGKVADFAVAAVEGKARAKSGAGKTSTIEEDAISTLIALGERRSDAESLLERARQSASDARSTESLVREMLRLRSARV